MVSMLCIIRSGLGDTRFPDSSSKPMTVQWYSCLNPLLAKVLPMKADPLLSVYLLIVRGSACSVSLIPVVSVYIFWRIDSILLSSPTTSSTSPGNIIFSPPGMFIRTFPRTMEAMCTLLCLPKLRAESFLPAHLLNSGTVRRARCMSRPRSIRE